MSNRVKFTAKPGAHFVVRPEAYKRITEALEAKIIHYAHRKVIVKVAQTNASDNDAARQSPGSCGSGDVAENQALTASAAAAVGTALSKKQAKQP
jgi:hypothetical protein